MKRSILILILICALLTGAVSAAFVSPGFEGGMLSGMYADGGTLYVTDIQNKVVWRIEDGEAEVFAGDRHYRDINGIVIADYYDAPVQEARFMEPWAIVPFLDGWAVSDAGANSDRQSRSGSQSGSGRRRSTPPRASDPLAEAYATLGCSPTVSDEEIKRAYREKAKKLHPDEMMAQGLPPELIQKANDEMARVNAAYDLIRKSRKD